jgi:hypothetical protein
MRVPNLITAEDFARSSSAVIRDEFRLDYRRVTPPLRKAPLRAALIIQSLRDARGIPSALRTTLCGATARQCVCPTDTSQPLASGLAPEPSVRRLPPSIVSSKFLVCARVLSAARRPRPSKVANPVARTRLFALWVAAFVPGRPVHEEVRPVGAAIARSRSWP